MGVWIEIVLKTGLPKTGDVTPCMGVWIEICLKINVFLRLICHSLYGSVD